MADIFISYAREDREAVRDLAGQLERRGWSVWWDRHILAGKEYDEVIQRELDTVSCVVVAWSKHSIGSRWVKAEADEGARRRILVPIGLDESLPPLGFRNLQTVSFAGSVPGLDSAPFQDLVDAIADLAGAPQEPLTPASAPASAPASSGTPARQPAQQVQPAAAGQPAASVPPPASVSAPPDPVAKDHPPAHFISHLLTGRAVAVVVSLAVIAVAGISFWPGLRSPQYVVGSPPTEDALKDFVTRFIAAGSSGDVERMLPFYADRVDYYAKGLVDREVIRKDKEAYLHRWSSVSLRLQDLSPSQDGPATGTKLVKFTCHYDVGSPGRGAHASGITATTLIVAPVDGTLKIIDQKESVEADRTKGS